MAKIPTTNITDDIVVSVINSGGGHVGGVIDAFKKSSNLRVWARFKPTIKSDVLFHTPADITNGWWHADNGWCGLILPKCSMLQEVKGKDFSTLWEYDAPYGKADCRWDDLGGYNTEARHPVNSLRRSGVGDVVYFDDDRDLVGIYCKFNDNRIGKGYDDGLDISDFKWTSGGDTTLDRLYYGLIVSRDDNNYCSYITLDQTLKELTDLGKTDNILYPYKGGDMSIWLPSRMLRDREGDVYQRDGAYTLYPCLFYNANPSHINGVNNDSIKGSTSNISIANGFLPLPVAPIAVNVVRKTSYITVSFVRAVRNTTASDDIGTALDVTLRFTNNDPNTDYEFSEARSSYVRVGIRRYYGFDTGNNPNYNENYTMGSPIGGFTLPKGGTIERTFTTPYSSEVPKSDGIAQASYEVTFVGNKIGPYDGWISQEW